MKCPNCKQEVPDEARVCGYCGTALKEPAGKQKIPTAPRPAPKPNLFTNLPQWVWLPAGIGVLGVIVVLAFILLSPAKDESAPVAEAPAQPEAQTAADSQSSAASEEIDPSLAYLPESIHDVLVGVEPMLYSDCSKIDSSFYYAEGKVSADGSRITTQAEGLITTPETLVPGNAVLVKFMMKADEETEWMMMGIDAGAVDLDYQAMEIAAVPGDFRNVIFHGNPEDAENIYEQRFDSMEEIDFNQWYYVLFAILEDGQVYLRVWSERNPSLFAENIEDFDIPENEYKWRYLQHVMGSGSIHLDDFWTLEFEALR